MKASTALCLLTAISLSPIASAEAEPSREPAVIPRVEFNQAKLGEIGAFLAQNGNVNVVVAPSIRDLVLPSVTFRNVLPTTALQTLSAADDRFYAAVMRESDNEIATIVVRSNNAEAKPIQTRAFNLRPIYFAMKEDHDRFNQANDREPAPFDPKQMVQAVQQTCEDALETRLEAGDESIRPPQLKVQRDTMMLLVSGSPEVLEIVGEVLETLQQPAQPVTAVTRRKIVQPVGGRLSPETLPRQTEELVREAEREQHRIRRRLIENLLPEKPTAIVTDQEVMIELLKDSGVPEERIDTILESLRQDNAE